MDRRLRTDEFDYVLPEELIAKEPASKREGSRLMVLDRDAGTLVNKNFFNLPSYLKKGDVLVLNDTKVIPARLSGIKTKGGSSKEGEKGARVEALFLRRLTQNTWECLVQPAKRIKKGYEIEFDGLKGRVVEEPDTQRRIIAFEPGADILSHLKSRGQVPLPPYINEKLGKDADKEELARRYQTVYAKAEGASAAPTAGLHFTPELLKELEDKGVKVCYITLHTGAGTFKPVFSEFVDEHTMFSEEYIIPEGTAYEIARVKLAASGVEPGQGSSLRRAESSRVKGGRVVAVGTTVTRTLEDCFLKHGKITEAKGEAGLFIYPPFKFNVVDALITNFHFPRSTLLMMVSAFAGKEFILNAYREAAEKKYRFFSFGDAMFIV
ncbi:MAG: tRNA preQ1(34) S-adenosylmethionine ribosyltransferase-isomerase QueA [Candidatus Margulisiibacteriota bacterium]